MLKLKPRERVVCAFAEPVFGKTDWVNTPLFVIIFNPTTGDYREESLQPGEQTAEMRALYKVSAAAHMSMRAAVKNAAGAAGE